MSEDRRRILDMLAAGQISVDDAQRLLDKVEPPPAPAAALEDPPARKGPRYLRIHVVGDDKVELQIPLALIRTGIRLGALVPDSAKGKLKKSGFDIDRFFEASEETGAFQGPEGIRHSINSGIEDLVDSLAELEINIEGEEGERVRLYCE